MYGVKQKKNIYIYVYTHIPHTDNYTADCEKFEPNW
jgi:hypothetical protein